MLYSEFLQLWDASVQLVDVRDWGGSLSKLEQVSEPTARTLFNTASAHLALGRPDLALNALDLALVKDEHLAVGFFQRSTVLMLLDRLEEALSDCIWAQKHMRNNGVIDYKQLGLRFKLHTWQVLYNAAGVYSRMGHWDQAAEVLETVSREKSGRGPNVESALEQVQRRQVLAPLLIPEGVVFRPNKREVDQLRDRDFLGKAKVISSLIPNDDFGGFEPLRLQKPGFYEPSSSGGAEDSRYLRVNGPYMSRGAGQLTVPGGAVVFLFGEEDKDGMTTVIYDGQRGLLPVSLLESVDVNSAKGKRDKRVPNGIPLPPELKPPTRPQLATTRPEVAPGPVPPLQVDRQREVSPPPSYTSVSSTAQSEPGATTTSTPQVSVSSPGPDSGPAPILVKVHFTQTLSLSVPADVTVEELKEGISQKLNRPPSELRLRRKVHGSRALLPLDQDRDQDSGPPLQDLMEAGRVQLWCQKEDPLHSRTVLYQMVALYDYTAQGPEDLEFSEGDTVDILGEVNEEWLEGHCAGFIGIFPACFAFRENSELDLQTTTV